MPPIGAGDCRLGSLGQKPPPAPSMGGKRRRVCCWDLNVEKDGEGQKMAAHHHHAVIAKLRNVLDGSLAQPASDSDLLQTSERHHCYLFEIDSRIECKARSARFVMRRAKRTLAGPLQWRITQMTSGGENSLSSHWNHPQGQIGSGEEGVSHCAWELRSASDDTHTPVSRYLPNCRPGTKQLRGHWLCSALTVRG